MDNKLKLKADELNKMAAHGEPMPDGLTQPEQMYFQTMRLLYRQYNNGVIDRDQAVKEKRQALDALDDAYFEYRRYKHHAEIERVFQREFYKDGNGCKPGECRMYDIICGLVKGEEETI